MGSNLLFIGNGFDLALDLKTAYKHFVNSRFWPLANKKTTPQPDDTLEWDILAFTQRVRDNQTGLVRWIDLEDIMYNYALHFKNSNIFTSPRIDIANKNKSLLDLLKYSFSQYLRSNVNVLNELSIKGINNHLHIIFDAIYKMDSSTKIYSFNYTDTASILTKFFNWSNPDVTHMHGRVTDSSSNIILGVNDRSIVEKNHRFLLKSHQDGFISTNLFNDLHKAQTIIFYGLSFGANDMDYFKDFFKNLIDDSSQRNQRINIYIFTLDKESIASIKSFFEDADVSVRDLYLHTNLHFLSVSHFGDGAEGDAELQSFKNFCQEHTTVIFTGGIM